TGHTDDRDSGLSNAKSPELISGIGMIRGRPASAGIALELRAGAAGHDVAHLLPDLDQLVVERHIAVEHDLQSVVGSHTHAAGVRGLERNDHSLPGEPELLEDGEDLLDFLQRDCGQHSRILRSLRHPRFGPSALPTPKRWQATALQSGSKLPHSKI